MPIYEYECRRCNAQVEVMQKMADKPLLKCTKCGGRLEKQWSSTSFQLKGTGWYASDYAVKTSEAKSETQDGKKGTTEETVSKTDEKPGKGEGKSGAAKTETTASDKQPSTTKKPRPKNASSGANGD